MQKSKNTEILLRELSQLLSRFESTDLIELEWEGEDYGFKVVRGSSRRVPRSEGRQVANNGAKSRPELVSSIYSNVVGVFHFAPEIPAVGTLLSRGQALGYVEAVSVKHTVEVETAAFLSEIHVENGQPVEYGQVLFSLEQPHVS